MMPNIFLNPLVLVPPFNSKMRNFTGIFVKIYTTVKHYRSMVSQDQYLQEVFPSAPIVAYKRQKNIREVVIKAKVPPLNSRSRRVQNGFKKCNSPSCLTCPYAITGKLVKATATKYSVEVNRPVSCDTMNVIYLITCKHCREQYVGETLRTAHSRFSNHRGYVNRKEIAKATGNHFNLPGHSVSDMNFQIIEKVFNKDDFFRKEREKMFIQKFNSKVKGINRIS